MASNTCPPRDCCERCPTSDGRCQQGKSSVKAHSAFHTAGKLAEPGSQRPCAPLPCPAPACPSSCLSLKSCKHDICVIVFAFSFTCFFFFPFALIPQSHYPPLRQPLKCTSCEYAACICSCKMCVLSGCVIGLIYVNGCASCCILALTLLTQEYAC